MNELKDNSGECVFSVSGSIRGIRVTLLGRKDQIIEILRVAMRSSCTVREIIHALISGGNAGDNSVVENQRLTAEKKWGRLGKR
jgi:hypothetical protein